MQQMSEMTIELQFLEHHKKQYWDLSSDFSSISSITRVLGIPPPQGRMRFLTKSGLGASGLAFSAQEAGAGQRLRHAAKTGSGAHLPAGELTRKVLPVALPLSRPLREEQPPAPHQRRL